MKKPSHKISAKIDMPTYMVQHVLFWLLVTQTCNVESTNVFSTVTASTVNTSSVAAAPIASKSVTTASVTTTSAKTSLGAIVQLTNNLTITTVSTTESSIATVQSLISSTMSAPAETVSVPTVQQTNTSTITRAVSTTKSSIATVQSLISSTMSAPAETVSVPTVQPTNTSTITRAVSTTKSSIATVQSLISSTMSVPAATVSVKSSGITTQSTLATATAATSTNTQTPLAPTTTESSVCSPGYCKSGGRCSIERKIAECACLGGFGGKFCESFVRFYNVTLAANDESGVPMTYDASLSIPSRKKLETRLCNGIKLALKHSGNLVFQQAIFNCTLFRVYAGSLMAELITVATFHPSLDAVPKPENITQALKDGISATNATFCNASGLIVDYANSCVTPSERRCSPHATCSSSAGTYSCACHANYTDDSTAIPGTNCTQQCAKTRCPGPNQYCQQRPGQPVLCECSEGFGGPTCTPLPLSRAKVGLIVGNVVLIMLASAALVIYCLVRRNRRRSNRWQQLNNNEGDNFNIELNSDSFSRL